MGSGSAVEMPSDGTEVRGSEGSRKITQGDGGGSSGTGGGGDGGGGAGREKVFDFEWNSRNLRAGPTGENGKRGLLEEEKSG
ncbi:hypothetical protein HZH66_009800 [Vespula vulgaris]|uniref:Uncharacterized protein n=1 Tax=Vespula vulgaris TaxID=7454 RepID=A0A834MZN0_VESVU|nr:hypothetical protein HZH66_009800 [Vespula vulgaris]